METVAIYKTNNFIRLTQAKTNKKKQVIFKEYKLDIACLRKEEIPLSLKAFLKQNRINCENLYLSIPRNQVSVRYLNLPSVDSKEIKRMAEYELSNLFPYKPQELIFDDALIETKPGGYSRVMLAAVQGEVVKIELDLLKQAGLIPASIGISTISLFNQSCGHKGKLDNYLLINLEDNLLDILVVHKQKLCFSRGVDLKQEKHEQRLIKEVREVYGIQETKGITLERIILCGRGIDLNSLALSLRQAQSCKVEINETICVGAGSVLEDRQNALSIDLLPKTLKIQKDISRRRKSVLYLIMLLILNTSLFANLIFLKIREKQEYLYFLKLKISEIKSDASLLRKKMLNTQTIRDYTDSGRLTLGLLSELYRIAPDGIRLSSLEIRGQSPDGILLLTGRAKDTQTVLKFVSLIKDSALIKEADVNYITKKQSQVREVVDFEIHSTF